MNLRDWIKARPGRADALANSLGTSAAYIGHLCAGRKRCGEGLAIEIEKATSRAVTCEELRPDVDWAYLRASGSRGDAA
ncbi:YdaS family helix-turn-helix protein [Jeongeupia sp. USM3]|uniref:transcriptional regulator n=1 Tax=Jeongeupia sp. USM3 TaxID=1906741 RepID=UPI0009F53D66